MAAKEWFIKVCKIVGFWLLDLAKKAWEECLKDYLHKQLEYTVHQVVTDLNLIHDSEAYEVKKKEILDSVFAKVKLPIALKPFRWLIKKILYNAVEEKIKQALDKLNTLI